MPAPKNNKGIVHPKMIAGRFKPGQSGNPGGPGKRKSFEMWVAEILDEPVQGSESTKRELIARRFVQELANGNGQMVREYLAREWPAATSLDIVQRHEVSFTSPAQYEDPNEWSIEAKSDALDRSEDRKPN